MELYSTQKQSPNVHLKEAIFKGLPEDNGLFMPTHIPTMPDKFFSEITEKSFTEIAFEVSKALLGEDVPETALKELVEDAVNFDAPVVHLHDNIHVLELFHGPTLAFKDFGARFMSRLMGHFLKEEGGSPINILVATSGDTGSAVAQGFLGVPNIHVTILYPSGKVSEIQEKQLTTIGQNVTALEVDGTFDDCQRMVKQAFLDTELNQKLRLTSANSINIARLIPQSFYYFYAYAQLKAKGKPVVCCVPSGNFGNLCAGLIGKKMGLPIHKFVAATNANAIVPHYLETGAFLPKPSVKTYANAMDVGNPSNFPRMQAIYGHSLEAERADIVGTNYSDEQTLATIDEVYKKTGYVLCPHSAIGYLGLRDYLATLEEEVNGVFLSTAHPAKFGDVVAKASDAPIEIPERLQQIVNREKKALQMDNDFEKLKAHLLG